MYTVSVLWSKQRKYPSEITRFHDYLDLVHDCHVLDASQYITFIPKSNITSHVVAIICYAVSLRKTLNNKKIMLTCRLLDVDDDKMQRD